MWHLIGFPLIMIIFLARHRHEITYIGNHMSHTSKSSTTLNSNHETTKHNVIECASSDSNGMGTKTPLHHHNVFVSPSSTPASSSSSSSSSSISTVSFCRTMNYLHSFDLRWTHFFRPYRSETLYWQPIAMLRRFIFALISVLLIESPTTKYVMYGLFGFASLIFHQLTRPFHSNQLNQLESISYTLLICLSYLLTMQSPPYSLTVEVGLFALIVPFASALIVITVRGSYKKMRGGSTTERILTTSTPSAAFASAPLLSGAASTVTITESTLLVDEDEKIDPTADNDDSGISSHQHYHDQHDHALYRSPSALSQPSSSPSSSSSYPHSSSINIVDHLDSNASSSLTSSLLNDSQRTSNRNNYRTNISSQL